MVTVGEGGHGPARILTFFSIVKAWLVDLSTPLRLFVNSKLRVMFFHF